MKKIIYTAFLIYLVIFFSYNKGYKILEKTPSNLLTYKIASSPYQGTITYLINLDRSKDRLDYMMPKINQLHLPFQRIKAVDGNSLTKEEISKNFDFNKYLNFMGEIPRNGTLGCSLSHINTWKKFLKSNYEYALILEDDIDFDPILLKKTINSLIKNKDLWDINSFEFRGYGFPATIKTLSDNKLVVYLGHVTHSGAYLISRQTAVKLLSKSLPVLIPVDHYFTRGWELDLKFTGIEPRLVYQAHGSSEIAQSGTINLHARWSWPSWNAAIFQAQTKLIKFLYNLKIWWQLKT